MTDFNNRLKQFAIELYQINAIKFGEYKLKTGLISPIYCDLRVIVSHPKIMDKLSELLIEKVTSIESYQILCGVPYTALPIATAMSIRTGIPMVLRRKEVKDYGTKKLIEGNFQVKDNCLIVEDVVTSGSSILETTNDLKNAGLNISNAVVVLNREQGGTNILKENGINLYSLLTISELMRYLLEAKCIDQDTVQKVEDYLKNSQLNSSNIQKNGKYWYSGFIKMDRLKMSYMDRIPHAVNPVGKRLLQVMRDKQTNLCIAADFTSSSKILAVAEKLGPYICVLKTHVDIIEDFTKEFIDKLQSLAKLHNFLIMEDRKFADIGKTVFLQYHKGLYHISSWADLVTVHSLPGKGIIQALSKVDEGRDCGIFLLAEMSSTGNLINDSYTSETIKLAKECSHNIVGIVGQSCKFLDMPGLIQLTPGIQLNVVGDNFGQQYNSPEEAILERGADIGVVGRGIIQSENPVSAAISYQHLLWNAYLKRIMN